MAAIQLKQFQLDAIADLHKAVSGRSEERR